MGHPWLPKPPKRIIIKSDIVEQLKTIDQDSEISERILNLETSFREKIENNANSTLSVNSKFRKFNTSPFVLMMHCFQKQYQRISQIENDILPAKLFSSMETSAGRMVEEVTLPKFNWEIVLSGMHTQDSALDGRKRERDTLKLATLKSGPRCLNDEMSENFADAIINNSKGWANEFNVKKIEFIYGVLYGTQKQSNKKDWHILRNLYDKTPESITLTPENRWKCSLLIDEIEVNVAIKIGTDWWNYLGGDTCLMEICIALIRACVKPDTLKNNSESYLISDLDEIVNTKNIPKDFNVRILQKSQLEWLFFLYAHFCDELVESN